MGTRHLSLRPRGTVRPLGIFLVVSVLASFPVALRGQLVGPGGVTPYGSGGRRHGGYARVREPGKGFFVGGSTLDALNGVYERVNSLPTALVELHNFSLAYRNKVSDWVMALVDAPPADELGSRPYQAYGGKRNEWVIIDDRMFDRVAHEGETIIPGSGERWGHVYHDRYGPPTATRKKPPPEGGDDDGGGGGGGGAAEEFEVGADGQQVFSNAGLEEEARKREDELPWQVIMIGDEAMVRRLQRHAHYIEHKRREAARWRQEHQAQQAKQRGGGLDNAAEQQAPPLDMASSAAALAAALGPAAHAKATEAEEAEGQVRPGSRDEWIACGALYEEAAGLASQRAETAPTPDDAAAASWGAAVLHWFAACAFRRARDGDRAEAALVQGSLRLRPRYTRALQELALVRLDRGDYSGAIRTLEELLRLDRGFPHLGTWLLRAHAHARRQVDEDAKRQAQAAYLGAPPDQPPSSSGLESESESPGSPSSSTSPSTTSEGGGASEGGGSVRSPEDLEALLDHYQVLDVPHDFTADELRKAYRKMSLLYHPDKRTGTPGAFARVNSAHQVLSGDTSINPGTTNQDLRREYDEAWAVPASHLSPEQAAEGRGPFLRAEIRERYFPDQTDFFPFGDPFEDYPERRQRRTELREDKERRAASLWFLAHPVTPFTLPPTAAAAAAEV